MDKNKRQTFDEIRARLEKTLSELQTSAKIYGKKAVKATKYVYIKGGHAKNEFLGFLTVMNFNRALDVKIKRFIEYDPEDKKLYLDIYERDGRDKNKKLPVFVYIHGGGWIGGLPENREAFTTRVAADGYFVVSLFYGHAPQYKHPRPIENIFKAFAWIKAHAEEYNIDADNIFLGGESAGAFLAAMAAVISSNPDYNSRFDLDEKSRYQKIRGVVLNCGVYDLVRAVEVPFKNIGFYVECFCGGPIDEAEEKVREEIRIINYVTPDFPPVLAISAENDKLATQTFDLVAKLDDMGVEVRHFHGTGRLAVHAFAVAQVLKVSRRAMAEVRVFMREQCSPEALPDVKTKRKKCESAKTEV